jgi:hypothetical protein
LSSFFVIPGGQHGLLSCSPTHWMPLPDSPTSTEDSPHTPVAVDAGKGGAL